MVAVNTPFGTNRGKYNLISNAALINCFVEIDQQDVGRARYVVLECEGSVQFCTGIDTPCRGMIYLPDLDLVYSVHSSSVYKIDSNGDETFVGQIPGTDAVEVVRNQNAAPEIGIRCNAGVYVVQNDVVNKFENDDVGSAVSIRQMGSYTVFATSDGEFFISGLNDMTSVNPLDFGLANSSPDDVIRLFDDGSDLLVMGEDSIEVYRDTGNSDFPFEQVGNTIRQGLGSKFSVQKFDNSVVFIADDDTVRRLDSYNPTIISKPEISRLIESDPNKSTIESMQWTKAGHKFYNITGTNWSKTYDSSTGQWHDRESYLQTRWRGRFAVRAFNKVLIGDRLSGDILYLDENVRTENSQPLITTAIWPDMHAFPDGGIVDAFHLDAVTGRGVRVVAAQGSNPKGMLSWSNDGGNTFGPERIIELGAKGKFKSRVTTRRLGGFGRKGRVWKWRVSDPVPSAFALADAEVRGLDL